ncbi:MAG: hypothetical protein JJU05_00895 [Verrucomicrobia bacterium]|nr:hypothetical protein [Verrucomicrobiota bacterium]MCH8525959.1 glycosyltransferase [Kiritimatiellia bacterium]
MKSYAIFTACDAKFGDFLIDHWLKSLCDNVDLRNLEPVVLDYGLSTAQRFFLEQHETRVVPCKRDGHVVNLRFRDMASVLEETPYEQVVLSDSGDIIFQTDFTSIFQDHPGMFRGVTEELKPGFDHYVNEEFFSKEDCKRLQVVLREKDMVNAGFIAGPGAAMRDLGRELMKRLKSPAKFGPDQIIVNDVFYREGFRELDRRYNYVIATSTADLEIRNGRFFVDGDLVSVVHNTGNVSFLRPVENFGYGENRNQLKKELAQALKVLYTTTDGISSSRTELQKRVDAFTKDMSNSYTSSVKQLEAAWNRLLEQLPK